MYNMCDTNLPIYSLCLCTLNDCTNTEHSVLVCGNYLEFNSIKVMKARQRNNMKNNKNNNNKTDQRYA